VDDGVHPPERVDLVCNASGFDGVAEIADDNTKRERRQIMNGGGALTRSRVQRNLVTLVDERPCRGAPQSVCAAGDEDATHVSAAPVLRITIDAAARK
jgi:hypothetical protein